MTHALDEAPNWRVWLIFSHQERAKYLNLSYRKSICAFQRQRSIDEARTLPLSGTNTPFRCFANKTDFSSIKDCYTVSLLQHLEQDCRKVSCISNSATMLAENTTI